MKPNFLLLERRGCEFNRKSEPEMSESIGNYRVTTPGEIVPMKNGKNYLFEFCECERRHVRTTTKTGRPFKHPVIEIEAKHALHVSTEYTAESGLSFRDSKLENEIYNWGASPYDEESILDVVNHFSSVHYDAIKYVINFETIQPQTRDWTPGTLIHEWAAKNNLEEKSVYFERRVRLYSGWYKYGWYNIKPLANGTDLVTVTLERVED